MERTHFLICVLVLVVSLYTDEVECRRRVRTGGVSGISGSSGSAAIYGYVFGGLAALVAIIVIVWWCVRKSKRQNPSINARGIPLATTRGQPRTTQGTHSVPMPYVGRENPSFHGSQVFSTGVSKSQHGNVVKGPPHTFQQY